MYLPAHTSLNSSKKLKLRHSSLPTRGLQNCVFFCSVKFLLLVRSCQYTVDIHSRESPPAWRRGLFKSCGVLRQTSTLGWRLSCKKPAQTTTNTTTNGTRGQNRFRTLYLVNVVFFFVAHFSSLLFRYRPFFC